MRRHPQNVASGESVLLLKLKAGINDTVRCSAGREGFVRNLRDAPRPPEMSYHIARGAA